MARSFFSSTKKWFGAASAGTYNDKAGLKTTGYGPNGYCRVRCGWHKCKCVDVLLACPDRYSCDGIEAQARKLADFAFMLGDYDLAGQTYQAIRREYQHDKAWKYMAGAQV